MSSTEIFDVTDILSHSHGVEWRARMRGTRVDELHGTHPPCAIRGALRSRCAGEILTVAMIFTQNRAFGSEGRIDHQSVAKRAILSVPNTYVATSLRTDISPRG